jgi:hypothetical protein
MAELNDGYRSNDAVPADGQFAGTPKNPGDRGFDRGQTITLEVDNPDNYSAGQFVDFDGAGGIEAADTDGTGDSEVLVDPDGVVKTEPGVGEQGGNNPNVVAVHTYGVVRALPLAAHIGSDTPSNTYADVEGVKVIDGSDENPILKF